MSSPSFETLFRSIDDAAPAMQTRLLGWAAINSGTSNSTGVVHMAQLMAAELRTAGAAVELVHPSGGVAPLVRARLRPEAPVRVLLCGHLDTVYDAAHAFQHCTRVDADTLRGPGVADMKGGLVVMLAALRAFESSPNAARLGWEVLLVPDEETGSVASAPLLREAAARHQLAIVFEPALADGSIVTSRKGGGTFRITARGRAAHAGRDFSNGRNAIVALAHFISAVHFLNDALPDVVVNVGSITGGGAANIVPEHAMAGFDIRAMRGADIEELLRRMRAAAATVSRANEVLLETTGTLSRPPMEETPASRGLARAWCEGAQLLGTPLGTGHSGGGSDANILAATGLPCIDGAGVEGGELHSEREWVRLSSLARRARIAALFLHRLAAGEIAVPARGA